MSVTLDRAPGFARGDALPPTWHWLYFHDLVPASQLGRDGHPELGITMPPVPLPRRMWAAGSMRFDGELRLGTDATRRTTIASIAPKLGRSGPLCFVTVEHEIRGIGGGRVVEQQRIVYRELDAGGGGPMPAAPENASFSQQWDLDSTALFRYSALTFNGHRIHYDLDYARQIEGYPGLVIHGPLLAALLADAAHAQGGPLASFEYRARTPLFVPESLTINGDLISDGATLWAAGQDGRLAMDATASYAVNRRSL